MPCNRKQLQKACINAFGEQRATADFVASVEGKLSELGLRLGQVYWLGPGKMAPLQVRADVLEGTSTTRHAVQIHDDLNVAAHTTELRANTLGFGQKLVPDYGMTDEVDLPRIQMGDYID